MSNVKHPAARRSGLRTWGLYLLALTAWVTGVIALAFMGLLVCSSMTWSEVTPLYMFLIWVRDYLPFVGAVVVLVGWVVISYFFIARPARDVQLLLDAAADLASPSDTPIRLPASLQSAEVQLNLVRQQALHTAQAAREAEQRKNDLVVYLAHDLKTPLTSVLGYLTLLRDEPQLSEPLRRRYTDIALNKAQRLEDLINEFFDITRFSLTHLELTRREIDLTRLLEQLENEFEPVLARRRLHCELHLPPQLKLVCDPDKLARVFDNLLNNACHYAYPDTAVTIRAAVENGWVVLTMENAGSHIPPEKLSRMFEQFFRLDSSRGTEGGNAGLGLAIAKEIVEAHGGTIEAASEGESIRFTVRLPVS